MSTRYFRLNRDVEFIPDKHFPASTTLTLTRFARAYQNGKPVASGIQITTDKDHFVLTDSQAIALACNLLKPYTMVEEMFEVD